MLEEKDVSDESIASEPTKKPEPIESYNPRTPSLSPEVSRELLEPEKDPQIEDLTTMADELDEI
jgi:hypothetical protein